MGLERAVREAARRDATIGTSHYERLLAWLRARRDLDVDHVYTASLLDVPIPESAIRRLHTGGGLLAITTTDLVHVSDRGRFGFKAAPVELYWADVIDVEPFEGRLLGSLSDPAGSSTRPCLMITGTGGFPIPMTVGGGTGPRRTVHFSTLSRDHAYGEIRRRI